MSPADRRYWALAHRRVAGLEGDVRAALLRAFAIVRDSLSEAELVRLIGAGQLERIVTQVFSDQVLDRAFIPFRSQLRDTVQSGFRYTVPELPKAGKIDGVLAVQWDHLNPDILTSLQSLDTRVMTALKDDVRESVRQTLQGGIIRGEPHRTIAKEIRGSIGLGPSQVEQVQHFRDALMGVEGRDVASYTLRNKTVDRLLTKGPLSTEQVDRYTETYRKARVAQNSVTVAKTATLDSYRAGQNLSWKSAQSNGVIPAGFEMAKTWVQVQRPTKRPEHVALAGETVPFDEPYSNGSMIPGDQGEYNCACLSRMKVVRVA